MEEKIEYNVQKDLEEGCGFKSTYSKDSLCKKGNLCPECRNSLNYYNLGRKQSQVGMIKIEDVEKMIDEMYLLLRPHEIKEIRLWKGRELDKWKEHRFFDDVEIIKKFEIMKNKLKQSLQKLGEKSN